MSTQNWHCWVTTFSPVIGIKGVTEILVGTVGVGIKSVAVGSMGCPAGGAVHTGVGDANVSLPQADVKYINSNAPIRTGRDILFISKASRSKIFPSIDIDAGISLWFPTICFTHIEKTNWSLNLL